MAFCNMAIYMDISVTEFKQRCLEIVRRVENSGKSVAITRHGRVVARLESGESVLRDEDFEALR